MAKLLGPFSVGYPVAFRSGGDTTREAFGKHIQEIEKIYGILNALDAGKVSSDDLSGIIGGSIDSKLQAHINSTNPHPNWKINLSDLTGTLDASKVVGNLTSAYIDASHVNNLASVVSGLVPISQDKGDGIIESDIKQQGYVKFNNGLILQWGTKYHSFAGEGEVTLMFNTPFPSMCCGLTASIVFNTDIDSDCNIFLQLIEKKTTSTNFTYHLQTAEATPAPSYAGKIGVKYIALGI